MTPPLLIDAELTLQSLVSSLHRVSWTKLQQHARCPGSWIAENHAVFTVREAHTQDHLHAIPGTILQRVWQAIINDRVYRREGLRDRHALATWAGRQCAALFQCIARPLHEQHQHPREVLRRYYLTEPGKNEFEQRAATHGLDPALWSHIQPSFVDHDRLFRLHGGERKFFATLARTFAPTLATLERRGLDLDGFLAEVPVRASLGPAELAGSIDFIWNRRRSPSGLFDDLGLLENGFVVLDGKFRLGPTTVIEQLDLYAAALRLGHNRTPSHIGLLCYGTGSLSLGDFDRGNMEGILDRVHEYSISVDALTASIATLVRDQPRHHARHLVSFDAVPRLTLTPGRLACRFCSISRHCPKAFRMTGDAPKALCASGQVASSPTAER